VARGVCPGCHVLLVEAASAQFSALETAEDAAVRLGATEVSNSWGGPECEGIGGSRTCVGDGPAFDHPDVVITVAAGDNGYQDWYASNPERRGYADYPASSPHVIAVGGTRLNQSGGRWQSETVWNDGGQSEEGEMEGAGAGGGGCSVQFTAPFWQRSIGDWTSVGCRSDRAVADVSADADPYTGVAVYDSTPVTQGGTEVRGWNVLGGTSVASPIIASVFALAGGAHSVEYPAQTLYENAASAPVSLHDVVSGSNGECLKPFDEETGESGCTTELEANSCARQLICVAHSGYDGPTGVGTPDGIAAFQPPAGGENQTEKGVSTGPSGSSGGQNNGTASPGGSPATVSSPVASATATTSVTTIQLSRLALTVNAIIALNRNRPRASQVGFTFTLNAAARLRVVLSKRVRVHGHVRWQTLRDSITIAAAGGRNSHRLSGHNVLASGLYRLTLSPVHGAARSIVFQIG
jgi:hypothetical protein